MPNELTTIPESDLTESEATKVRTYIESGLPGIGDINDTQLYRMLDLYMSGSTYSQISSTLEVKKIIVLYLAQSNNWYLAKKEYLNEIQEKIKSRVVDAKLRNKEFTLLLVQAWQKKISKNLTKYLSTNDSAHMDDIDLKEVAQLMKAIEMINELDNTGRDGSGKTPLIGIHAGDGVSIEKTGENKISITPKPSSIGDTLKHYADKQREEQKLKDVSVKHKSDIDKDTKE